MKQQEIQERNKQIALMLGLKRGWWIHQEKPLTDDKKQWCDIGGKTFLGTKIYYDRDLKFHSDWNWLMEAVEFIEKIYSYKVKIESKGCIIYKNSNAVIIHYSTESKLVAVFIAVSDFAKLYNNKEL